MCVLTSWGELYVGGVANWVLRVIWIVVIFSDTGYCFTFVKGTGVVPALGTSDNFDILLSSAIYQLVKK